MQTDKLFKNNFEYHNDNHSFICKPVSFERLIVRQVLPESKQTEYQIVAKLFIHSHWAKVATSHLAKTLDIYIFYALQLFSVRA